MTKKKTANLQRGAGSRDRLAEECVAARAAVAADPADEVAAEHLFDVLSRVANANF